MSNIGIFIHFKNIAGFATGKSDKKYLFICLLCPIHFKVLNQVTRFFIVSVLVDSASPSMLEGDLVFIHLQLVLDGSREGEE